MKSFATRTLPLISAALFALSCSASAQATVIDLGVANGYSAFIFGNIGGSTGNSIQSGFSSVSGSLAAGGNIYLNSYNVGTNKKPGSSANTLVAGGSLKIGDGTLKGTAVYGVTDANATLTAPSYYQAGTFSKGNAATLDFAAAKQQLTTLSSDVAKLQSNGKAVWENDGYTLHGDINADVNIFNIDKSELHNLTLDLSTLKSTASIIINGTASEINMSGGFINFSNYVDRTLFNFANASTTTVSSVYVRGSILAPNSAFSGSGDMTGTLIANSVNDGKGRITMLGSGFNTVSGKCNVGRSFDPGPEKRH